MSDADRGFPVDANSWFVPRRDIGALHEFASSALAISGTTLSVRRAPPSGARPDRRASRWSGGGPGRPRTLLKEHTLRTSPADPPTSACTRGTARGPCRGTRSRRPVTLAAGRCHAGGRRCHSTRQNLSRGLSQGQPETSRSVSPRVPRVPPILQQPYGTRADREWADESSAAVSSAASIPALAQPAPHFATVIGDAR